MTTTALVLLPVVVPAPVVPCVGVTFSGHRLLNWRLDDGLFEALVENIGWRCFSYRIGGVFIAGEWHITEARP